MIGLIYLAIAVGTAISLVVFYAAKDGDKYETDTTIMCLLLGLSWPLMLLCLTIYMVAIIILTPFTLLASSIIKHNK